MTLVVAWVRNVKGCEELVVSCDSRLNGARNMDCAQKAILLPRNGCFIAYAGDSAFTYPLMHLVSSAIAMYGRAQDGSMDICELSTHVARILTDSLAQIDSPYADERRPSNDTEFLFGGYSWVNKCFFVWKILYFKRNDQFSSYCVLDGTKKTHFLFAFAGDKAKEAKVNLLKKLNECHWDDLRKKYKSEFLHLDWEPFEVLRDMLRYESKGFRGKTSTIGGPPQVLKIYQHQNSKIFGIHWPDITCDVYIAGRRILSYETPSVWILDPDKLVTYHPYYSIQKRNADSALMYVRSFLISCLNNRIVALDAGS